MKLCLDQGWEQRINVAIKVQNTRDNVLPTENVLVALSLVPSNGPVSWVAKFTTFISKECLKYQNVAMASEEIMQMVNYKYFYNFNLIIG